METRNPNETSTLRTGETAEVKAPRIHRVVSVHGDRSAYILVQGVGTYDFIKE